MRKRKLLPCPQCGKRLRRPPLEPGESPRTPPRETRERMDLVRCTACRWEGHWSWFRQSWRGKKLLTGGGVEACRRFHDEWQRSRDPRDQMLLIDRLIHALHNGPLAPLFVEGERDAVLALLDELAGRT